MPLKTTAWDVQDSLQTPEDCALFIRAAIDEAGDDAQFLASVLRDVASSRGMQQLERAAAAGCQHAAASSGDQLADCRCLVALALAEINSAGGPKTDAGVVFVAGAQAMLVELAATANADPVGPDGSQLQ